MNHLKVRALCEGAIMVALATVLSYLKLFELPQGGAISIGMLPVLFYCCRWGLKDGLLCAFAYGLLQLMFDGAYAWGWTSMLLDYIVAYTLLGFAGFFARKKNGIFVGTVVGCALRFVAHFISGVTIYAINAPTEILNMTLTNPVTFSLVYNGSYMLVDTVICLAVFAALYKPLKKYIQAEDLKKA